MAINILGEKYKSIFDTIENTKEKARICYNFNSNIAINIDLYFLQILIIGLKLVLIVFISAYK